LTPGAYLLSVTAFNNNDVGSAPARAPLTLLSAPFNNIRVYPNPWRADQHAGVTGKIDGLKPNTSVKIFTVAGQWVKTLPVSNNLATWDLKDNSGSPVASGFYLYLLKSDGGKETGQIAVI